MDIKLKLEDVINIYLVTKDIIQEIDDFSLKFKLLGLMSACEKHVVNYDILKNELFNKYGEEDKDGNISIDRKSSKAKLFMEETNNILSSEVTLQIDKIAISKLNNRSAEELLTLYPILSDE